MTDYFDFRDYWPRPTDRYSIQQVGKNFDGTTLKSVFSVNPNKSGYFWQDDYIDDVWQARWDLSYRMTKQVVEHADWYPKKAYQFWTNRRVTSFVPGMEILWGGVQKVGDVLDQECKISFFGSTLFTAPNSGRQRVEFVDHYQKFTCRNGDQYSDVVEINYDQTWNGKTAGARQWHAKDVGIVQLSWRSEFNDTAMIDRPMVYKFSQIAPVTE